MVAPKLNLQKRHRTFIFWKWKEYYFSTLINQCSGSSPTISSSKFDYALTDIVSNHLNFMASFEQLIRQQFAAH